ncbi:CBS domain-containing protein [Acidianus sulfidivorans JP7]|uniref:Histidine kinase n=1 Tax=Acidianus sulfidivorans JP7 TaxID=619593 RepID=A0A2U9IKF8_9CREN|nr:CBS domain-containing protein [Acidianus sulfidivorans]AWR96527.1 CBS domain-containing protein [Acidianus sulfidivorans JP7]
MGIIRSSILLRPYDTLLYAIKIMTMEYIPKAIVVDEKGYPLGTITQKDIVKFVYSSKEDIDFNSVYISEVMRKDFVCVNENIDPLEAAQIMIDKKQPLLIACSEEGKALGMIIKSDLTQYYASQIRSLQKVGEFATSPAITCNKDDILSDTIKTLVEKDLSRLIVLDNEKIVGILTTTDLLYIAPVLKYKSCNIKIGDVMSPNIIVISSNEDLANAARLMAYRKIKGIPVVKDTGEIMGVITTTDVTRALLDDRVRKYLYELKMYTSTF